MDYGWLKTQFFVKLTVLVRNNNLKGQKEKRNWGYYVYWIHEMSESS